jgi:hypothetical protein
VQKYANLNILTVTNYPVNDIDKNSYAKELFAAA